jgi:hypothetical protein
VILPSHVQTGALSRPVDADSRVFCVTNCIAADTLSKTDATGRNFERWKLSSDPMQDLHGLSEIHREEIAVVHDSTGMTGRRAIKGAVRTSPHRLELKD